MVMGNLVVDDSGVPTSVTDSQSSFVSISSFEPQWRETQQTVRLNEFIGFEFSRIHEIERVYTAYRNRVFYVWVVISEPDPKAHKRIYDREKAIIDEFSSFEFDFYLIFKDGQDIQDLVSGPVELAYQRP